jgi:hypothetical protein
MFGRQWFGPTSQMGLEERALEFEQFLRKRRYNIAIELASAEVSPSSDGVKRGFWLRQQQRARRLRERCKIRDYVTVAFTGFWPGFRDDDNEVFNLLSYAARLVGLGVRIDYSDPDLFVFSCFGDQNLNKFNQATRVLYLGENIRPVFSHADYSLSFDMSDYCGRNIYTPLWLLRSNIYSAKTADYHAYDPTELEVARKINQGRDAVAYIGNNTTPTRVEAINELKKAGIAVDCFGSQTRPVSDKIKTLRQYRHSLCFENTYTPGYVTEKIIDSFLAGSMPLYWGGAPPDIFNLDEYFICSPYKTMASNILEFISWKNNICKSCMPALLRRGAFNRTQSLVVSRLATIIMDLF